MSSHTPLFIDALLGNPIPRTPFWFMRQAGRYLPEYKSIRATCSNFLEFCYTPDKASEVTLQPIRRFQMDAAIIFSDILVIPDAMGQSVRFEPNHGPKLDAIENLSDFKPRSHEAILNHLSPVFEAITRVRQQLPKEVALIGFAGAPWTIACYMIEGEGSKEFLKPRTMAYTQPKAFAKLIEQITEATIIYLHKQIDAGVQAIQLFDSWSGVLPESEFQSWVIEPTQKIVSALRSSYPHIPIIGFPRGSGTKILPFVKQTEVNAVSIDTSMPREWVRDHIQPLCTVQGNLDPVLLASDEHTMMQQAEQILSSFGNKPFVFNLGHGILPHTPVEHVARLCDRLRNQHDS